MLVKAKVFPKSKVNSVEKVKLEEKDQLSIVVRVSATPENGSANAAVMKLIAKFFQVNQSSVELIKGARCRNKVFHVRTIDETLLEKILSKI